MKITAKQIKYIHTLKTKSGLDDADYRAILSGYDVSSSKELDITAANSLIADMEILAFKLKEGNSTDKQRRYIQFLFAKIPAVNDIVKFSGHIVKRKIERIAELSKQEAIKVIDALGRYKI